MKVFLSHTGRDRKFARKLAKDIELLGFSVWFDEGDLRVGDSLIGTIEQGIKESTWMIVILSPAALASNWVLKELRTGLTREMETKDVFVLPVLYKQASLPAFLKEKFYADFTKSYEQGLKLIRDRLIGSYRKKKNDDSWFLVKNPIESYVRTFEPLFGETANGPPFAVLANGSFRQELANLKTVLLATSKSAVIPADAKKLASIEDQSSEMWFGESGRLILRRNGREVHGDYDWFGLSVAGSIEGVEKDGTIRFDWSWSLSSERGSGIFWTDIPNLLHGGWWMDFDNVDESAIIRKEAKIPFNWEFVRLTRLKVEQV